MRYTPIIFLAFLLLPFFSLAQNAQRPDTLCRIRLKDGSLVYGKLISRDSTKWILNSGSYGNMIILRDSTLRIEMWPASRDLSFHESLVLKASKGYKQGKPPAKPLIWFDNPLSSRYYIASSAIPMQKGDWTFFDSYLFYCQADYAISNHLSIGGGLNIEPSFGSGVTNQPTIVLNIKEGSKINDWLHVGGEFMVMSNPYNLRYFYSNEPFYYYYTPFFNPQISTMLMGMATIGNTNNNITAGVGYYSINSSPAPGPVFNLSGILRVGRRVCLISETWTAPQSASDYLDDGNLEFINNSLQYYFLTAYGIRIMGRKLALDMGLVNNQYIFPHLPTGIPYLGLTVKI